LTAHGAGPELITPEGVDHVGVRQRIALQRREPANGSTPEGSRRADLIDADHGLVVRKRRVAALPPCFRAR